MAMSIEIEDLIARGVLFAKIGSRKMRVIQAEFLAGDLRDEVWGGARNPDLVTRERRL